MKRIRELVFVLTGVALLPGTAAAEWQIKPFVGPFESASCKALKLLAPRSSIATISPSINAFSTFS